MFMLSGKLGRISKLCTIRSLKMVTTSVELKPFSDPSGETHNKAPQKCTHFSIR